MGMVTEVYSPGSFGPCSLGRNRGATARLGELHSHLPMRAHALVLPLIAALVAPQRRATLGNWPSEPRAARAAHASHAGGPRLPRREALERAAQAEVKPGHKQAACDFYNQALELRFFLMIRGPPRFTLFPFATLFR